MSHRIGVSVFQRNPERTYDLSPKTSAPTFGEAQFQSMTFVILKLKELTGRLTGTCTRTMRLNENSYGELRYIDERFKEDKIL